MSSGKTSSAGGRQWTDAQREAIEHPGGDLLISAAAGSGKTAVLAERCARLVCGGGSGAGQGTGVENLLVLTFTEAAAAEMRTRIAGALAAKMREASPAARPWLRRQLAMVDRASISTLHAFCMRALRQHFHEAGVDPAFEIMDEEEARLLQEEVLDGLLGRWHRLPATSPAGAATSLDGRRFTAFFEDFAQGSEAGLRDMVLAVHRMLASTADPERYMAAARRVYREDAELTMERYSTHTLADKVRLVRLRAQRARDEVAGVREAAAMLAGMDQALEVLDRAAEELAARGAEAWAEIKANLVFKWVTCKTIATIDDFEAFKERTWEAVKKALKGLAAEFGGDGKVMLEELRSLAEPLDTLLALTEQFQKAFKAAKRGTEKDEGSRLDFSDLEREALDLLTRPGSLAAVELRQRYHHMLVDEFQDINPLQAALLEAIRDPAQFGGQGNLFAVGDIKQSIYAFRLAQPELFLRREREARATDAARGAGATGPRKYIALQHNFRSQPKLLGVMNEVFGRILTPEVVGLDYAEGHELRAGLATAAAGQAVRGGPVAFDGVPVELHLAAMDAVLPQGGESGEGDGAEAGEAAEAMEVLSAAEREAEVVAARIVALMKEGRGIRDRDGTCRPLRYRDIAILLRTMKGKALMFARALSRAGIPVHADLSTGYFDTPEVKDALALLHVLDNAQQDIPLATAMLGPYGRFVHDDLAVIRLACDRKEVPFYQAVGLVAAVAKVSEAEGAALRKRVEGFRAAHGELVERLAAFFAKLSRWREWLRTRPLHEGLADIFTESKIFAWLAAQETGDQRVANLQMLHQRALKFSTFRKQGLHRFLRFIEKLRDEEIGDLGEASVLSEASDVVRILSVHKSKGLEFPVVFVSGLGNLLRLRSAGPVLVHRELEEAAGSGGGGIGMYLVDPERNIYYPSAASLRITSELERSLRAEELRLLYVAITRARDCLILTGHVREEARLESIRKMWQHHRGALPEDVLLRGSTALDWLLPAVASAGLLADAAAEGAALRVTVHRPAAPLADAGIAVQTPVGEAVRRILAGESLPVAEALPGELEALIARVTGEYAHEPRTRQAALQTVTFLKTQADGREQAGEFPDTPVAGMAAEHEGGEEDAGPGDEAERTARMQASRRRGIATHRVLELLDFARCGTTELLDEQIRQLEQDKRLTPEQIQQAYREGIRWFLWESAAGRRVIAAAEKTAHSKATGVHIRREIAFTWIADEHLQPGTDRATDLADLPTIRGVIDLLLVVPGPDGAPAAEIIDYKTDSAFLWQSRLNDYRRQMQYYLAAASDILGFPVKQATLVFLAAQEEVVVTA